MKRTTTKRLTLHRETLGSLDPHDLRQARGASVLDHCLPPPKPDVASNTLGVGCLA